MQSRTFVRPYWSALTRILGVALFAVATAISARISVVLPFSPVPLTLQVLVVVLSGLILGPVGGFAAQFVYLQAILLGAPMTAMGIGGPAAFMLPTAGYLWAFPAAAAAAGWIARRDAPARALWSVLGGLAALVVVYAGGMAWLAGYVGGLTNAWRLGVVPFVGVDLLKVTIASGLVALWRR